MSLWVGFIGSRNTCFDIVSLLQVFYFELTPQQNTSTLLSYNIFTFKMCLIFFKTFLIFQTITVSIYSQTCVVRVTTTPSGMVVSTTHRKTTIDNFKFYTFRITDL